ncbi:unnamed protein product [Protopolystoma xenopodis]|uniref:Uncharacterized protein n=1 Tax=Protopolystoma xenopodis TaxID=117903 RepID=A0A448WQU3_9PLAT|nr:unnamed protein product [Protopolystoma xenopodis]
MPTLYLPSAGYTRTCASEMLSSAAATGAGVGSSCGSVLEATQPSNLKVDCFQEDSLKAADSQFEEDHKQAVFSLSNTSSAHQPYSYPFLHSSFHRHQQQQHGSSHFYGLQNECHHVQSPPMGLVSSPPVSGADAVMVTKTRAIYHQACKPKPLGMRCLAFPYTFEPSFGPVNTALSAILSPLPQAKHTYRYHQHYRHNCSRQQQNVIHDHLQCHPLRQHHSAYFWPPGPLHQHCQPHQPLQQDSSLAVISSSHPCSSALHDRLPGHICNDIKPQPPQSDHLVPQSAPLDTHSRRICEFSNTLVHNSVVSPSSPRQVSRFSLYSEKSLNFLSLIF